MSDTELPAPRAAVRAVMRLLKGLARNPEAVVTRGATFDLARRRGWIERAGAGAGWRLSPSGRDVLKRALSGQPLAAASHAAPPRPEINAAESPLAWFRRASGRDGVPLISEEEFLAGERLRADFWFAEMTPRVTSRWDAVPQGGRRAAPGAGAELSDGVVAAQTRVRAALAAVGPDLSGVLIDVCCHLKGMEEAERRAGWPQRSGKVVLRLALAALARHYGIGPVTRVNGPARVRHWGSSDYRPRLDGLGDETG